MSDPICALCGRPIPPDVAQSLHHLIPKLKGGKGGDPKEALPRRIKPASCA